MSEHRFRARLPRLDQAPLTYAEVGATAGPLPAGYPHLRRARVLGRSVARFTEAADLLLSWQVHRRAGLRVYPSAPVVGEGVVALLVLGWGPLRIEAPVRVVRLIDEPTRRGFAYGTLPGHPETGEESFVVELGRDQEVSFTVTAFSRPASRLARLAPPVTRLAQEAMVARYLRAP